MGVHASESQAYPVALASESSPMRSRVVRLSQPIGLARLFRPLPKGGVRPVLNVSYRPKGGNMTLRFSARQALGIPEQTLLLALLELAKAQHDLRGSAMVLDAKATDGVAVALWGRLIKGDVASQQPALRVDTTWHELNRLYGEQIGGSATATRKEQLQRLCEVVVWEELNDVKQTLNQSFLVVMLKTNDERLHLALNARLAAAILEDGYAQISLSERSCLHKDVAKAVHAFLSTTIAAGRRLHIGVETLLDRFWPCSRAQAPVKTHSSRRTYIVDALHALSQLRHWTVQWKGAEIAVVSRIKNTDGNMTSSHIPRKDAAYRRPRMAICPNKINDLEAPDASGLFSNRVRVPE
jgi:hypothetical protein